MHHLYFSGESVFSQNCTGTINYLWRREIFYHTSETFISSNWTYVRFRLVFLQVLMKWARVNRNTRWVGRHLLSFDAFVPIDEQTLDFFIGCWRSNYRRQILEAFIETQTSPRSCKCKQNRISPLRRPEIAISFDVQLRNRIQLSRYDGSCYVVSLTEGYIYDVVYIPRLLSQMKSFGPFSPCSRVPSENLHWRLWLPILR